jgi:hypothetical protein
MAEIKISKGFDTRSLLKKIAGAALVLILVWLGFYTWLFTISVYDDMYLRKSGVSYLNIITLNNSLYLAFEILIGPAVLNPVAWYLVAKRSFKPAVLIFLLSVFAALICFSAVGQKIAVQIFLLSKTDDVFQGFINWLVKVYFSQIRFSGEELYREMPVFDFIELLKMLYVFYAAILLVGFLVAKIWSIKSFVKKLGSGPQQFLLFGEFSGILFSIFRILMMLVIIGYALLWYPASAYDVTSQVFRIALIVSSVLAILCLLLEKIHVGKSFLFKNILIAIVILTAVMGYVLPQAYYRTVGGWDANKVTYEFEPKIKPHIELVKLLNGFNEISEVSESPGSVEDLEKVRLTNHDFMSARTSYELSRIGIPWITWSNPSMIYFRNGRLYWIVFTTPVMVEATDVETAESFIYTHSEVILAFDATTGRTVPLSEALGVSEAPTVYYGLGGLFEGREMVFVNTGKWREAGRANYSGPPDYVFSDWIRAAFFLLRGRLDIASGGYGEVLNTLMVRDAYQRVSKITMPLLKIETDPRTNTPAPYPVVDPEGNLYLAFSTFVEKPVYTEYASTENYGVENGGCLRKPFSIILVNVRDGSMQGYMFEEALNNSNYVLEAIKSLYSPWVRPIPSWLMPQARYIKNLMWTVIDVYNTYRIPSWDYDSWYRSTGMFDFPRDPSGEVYSQNVFDIRYVSLGGEYVAICIVENYQKNPGAPVNIVGAYVFTPWRKEFVWFSNRVPRLSTIVDSIIHHPTVQQMLTLHQTRGISWIEGNLMVQLVNNTPILILPFYSISAQVAYVTMVAVYNPQNSKIGVYQVSNVDDWVEVSESAFAAYSSTILANVSLKPDYLKQVKTFLASRGLSIAEPISVSANVVYLMEYIKAGEFYSKADSAMEKLVDFCTQHGLNTVNIWVEKAGDKEIINVGVLMLTNQGVELHLVQIEAG